MINKIPKPRFKIGDCLYGKFIQCGYVSSESDEYEDFIGMCNIVKGEYSIDRKDWSYTLAVHNDEENKVMHCHASESSLINNCKKYD